MTTPHRKRPGPPKGNANAAKPPDHRRSERLALRITPRQWRTWAGAAADANLSLADWVRSTLDGESDHDCQDCGFAMRPDWSCCNPACPGRPDPGN